MDGDKLGSALLMLAAAALAHHYHVYLLSIPMATFAIVYLGMLLKEEMGL